MIYRYLRLTILCALASCSMTKTVFAEETYTLGVVPQFDARRIVNIWQPILNEIHQKTGIRLVLKTSPSIPEFENQFNAGEFDFAYMNPYHAIIANKNIGYSPILRDIGRSLYGIIVIRKDSSIQTVNELDGKTIAFPAPNALGAALIPRSEFAKKYNIKIHELYVKSHGSVYLNVALGKAVAGGGIQKTLSQQPESLRSQLRILYKTSKVPPHPIAAHPRLNKILIARIKSAFLELGKNEKGRQLLNNIPINNIGESSIDDYQALRNMGLNEFYVDEQVK